MTAFDDLQQHFDPGVQGSKRTQLVNSTVVGSEPFMHTVLDTDNPFFKALWAYEPFTGYFLRRSRAEAALLLPDAAIPFMEHGFSHTVKGWTVLGESFPVKVWHPTWLDALCAAIEAGLKAKEKP